MGRRPITAGLAGGLLAGALVGAAEAIAVWLAAPAVAHELPPLAWALLAYGALGALGGVSAGLLAAGLGTDGFALAFAGVAASLGFAAGRFRVLHDVLFEAPPKSPFTSGAELGALAGCALLGLWMWWRLRGAEARGRLLTRPAGAAGTVAAAAGAWLIAAGVLAPEPAARPVSLATLPAAAPHVLVIVIDSLRADHVGTYGSMRVTTPNMDGLAADGVRYEHAFAQASWTRPSVASILTGLYPSSHGAVRRRDVLPGGVLTLAEAMASAGYRTAGFPNDVDVSARFNFQQGFGEFRFLAPVRFLWASEEAATLSVHHLLRSLRERVRAGSIDVRQYYRPAEDVTAALTAWLDGLGAGERFFLLAHYMDPHEPYVAHEAGGVGYTRVALPDPPADMAPALREAYEGEVAYLDRHLGALFDDLRRRGLYDQMLIVLTADHGEEFHEHGGWWHGATLYDEQIAVPLIVKPPRGGVAGRVENALASSIDVAPTVLAVAGLPVPPVMQGHRLPLDGGAAPARDAVFAEENFEGNVLRAIRSTEWKLVTANAGNPRGLPELGLFALRNDPGEQTNLAASAAAPVEEWRAALGRRVNEARAKAGMATQTNVDDATRDRLKALGYVE